MGRLVKKGVRGNLPKIEYENDLNYRVISRNVQTDEIVLVGTYDSFEEARQIVDNIESDDLYFYIHGEENRVLYSSEEK